MRPWLWKYRFIILALVILFLFFVVFTAGVFGEYRTDYDVNSGRVRNRHIIWGVVVSEDIEDTKFSILVRRYALAQEPPMWGLMHGRTETLGPIMPLLRSDGIYGGFMANCEDAAEWLAVLKLPEAEEKAEVARLLQLVQKADVKGMRSETQKLLDLVKARDAKDSVEAGRGDK